MARAGSACGEVASVTAGWSRIFRPTFLVAIVLAGFFATSALYVWRVPLWEAPDEPLHFTRARDLAFGRLPLVPTQPKVIGVEYHPPLYYALLTPVLRLTDGPADAEQGIIFGMQRSVLLAIRAARLISTVLATLTLLLVYMLARRLLQNPTLAVATTALTALTPAFMMTSATVNDDSAAMLWSTLALLSAIQIVTTSRPVLRWPLLMLVGTTGALLTKITTLFLLPIAALALLYWLCRLPKRRAVTLTVVGICSVIVGLWLALTHDIGLGNRFLSIGEGQSVYSPKMALASVQALTTAKLTVVGDHLLTTYWSTAGWQTFAPLPELARWMVGLLAVGFAYGLARMAFRLEWWRRLPSGNRRATGVLCLGLGLVAAEMVLTDTAPPGLRDQGVAHARYVLPVISLISVAIIGGLAAALPRSARTPAFASLLVGLIALHVTATFSGPQLDSGPFATATALPYPVDIKAPPASFAGGVDLAGYTIAPITARPGDNVIVSLFWRARELQTADFTVFVHAVGADGTAVAKSDEVPTLHRFPPRVWRAGDVVGESRLIAIPSKAMAGIYRLEVGMYAGDPAKPIAVSAAALAQPQPGRVALGTLRVRPISPDTKTITPLPATFGDSLALYGYAIAPTDPNSARLGVTLFWQATKTPPEDFVASLQLLDPTGRLTTQVDAPAGGTYPATAWDPGEVVPDGRTLVLPGKGPPDRYTLALTVYGTAGGHRLTVLHNGARVTDDLLALGTVDLTSISGSAANWVPAK